MGKKILAVIMSGLLILLPNLPVPARGQPEEIQFIIDAAAKAAQAEKLDIESQDIADFLAASDAYDNLDEESRAGIPPKTVSDLETVRERIGEMIHTCDGVTAGSKDWYARTNVTDGTDRESIQGLLRETFPGSSPKVIYYKNISYTDIRSGGEYLQESMISITFPVPEAYESLASPRIFTVSRGKLMELRPVKNADGSFYLPSARTLSSIIIASLPVGLTGISMEAEAGINAGQSYSLRASPVPQDTTESYALLWESSNTQVVQVSKDGVLTGVRPGTAWVMASVKGREEMKAVCTVTVVQGADSLGTAAWEALEETRAYIRKIDQNPTIGSEWNVIGLARGGLELGEPYFSVYYNHFANYLDENKGKLTTSVKYTEYSKAVVTMTAMGRDARNVGGWNLLENLADFDNVTAQGINGPIWALIALNCNEQYTIPQVKGVKNLTTREKLLEYIVGNTTPLGGWDLMGAAPDPDMTGMALQALAPYYGKPGYENVTAAIEGGLEALSRIQDSDGGYSTMGVKTLESCAQVVTALCALGIDPETDARFIKGGRWTVEKLLSYHISGSGFMHVKAGEGNNGGGTAGEVNGMATEQGHYALVAYQRMKQGKTGLYDMSDQEIYEGGKGDGNGTGLEEPSPIPEKTPSPTPAPSGSSQREGNAQNVVTQGTGNTGTGANGGTVSGGNMNRGQPGSYAQAAAPAASRSISPGQVSENKKKSGKTQEEPEEGGWNFEAESYEEAEDGWDFAGESLDEGNRDAIVSEEENETEKENEKEIPPLAAGMAGGVAGAAAVEGARFLWKHKWKKRGK